MEKKEEFKNFVKTKPELIDYVKSGEMTWQKFYEIYDLYGEESKAWESYRSPSPIENVSKISDIVKGIDVSSIQKHIETAQKALGLVQEMTTKNVSNVANVAKGPSSPRPINKFFED